MINRAKMPRQMYGLGSLVKDRIRKLIPNELASVAVKAAPVVSVFNPGVGALMRGIGRFDQRGSISDAVKQGAGTFAFGAGARALGGADPFGGGLRGGFTSPLSPERTQQFTSLFDKQQATDAGSNVVRGGGADMSTVDTGLKGLVKKAVKKLPDTVVAQLTAGGITAGASLLASYFQGDFREQEPGETMEEYLAERKKYVGTQMRTYMDNYFANDPEYMKLDDAGRDAFVARYNIRDGGRVGYQTGGISMLNTLAQNIARNRAAQAAFRQAINPSQQKVLQRLQARQQAPSASETLGALYNKKGIDEAQSKFLKEAVKTDPQAYEKTGGGIVSDLRHKTAAAQLRDKLGGGITGQVAANVLGGIREIPQLLTGDLKGVAEDIKANFQGARDVPKGLTPQESFDYLISQQQVDPGVAATPTPDATTQGTIPGFSIITEGDKILYVGPDGQIYGPETYASIAAGMYPNIYDPRANVAGGGMPTGIMRSNKAGVMERDYRETGGFVPVGIKEKADDVPAMLSKNEFVFTADAVRGAGNGSIERGAQKMYDTMKKLEKRVV